MGIDRAEEVLRLTKLAKFISERWEVNTAIYANPGDVAYLSAVDVPHASQIVNVTGTYDVWKWAPQSELIGYNLQAPDLTIEQAAEMVKAEYFLAKAARTKQHSPHLTIEEIMKTLEEGYQRKKAKSTNG